jgi:hypothetical protein
MGFTKLDSGILQSSIMAEDSDTFKIWITLLACCNSDGIASVSPIYLSSICHISINDVQNSILKLSSPDEYSRSIAKEGRRIERVDGGFKIINYLKYRAFTYSSQKDAVRQRNYRLGKGLIAKGYIYFATYNDRIKIGYSKNPWARIRDLAIAVPEIKLIKAIQADKISEKILHEEFRHLSIDREWFKFDKEIKKYIEGNLTTCDVSHSSWDILSSASVSVSDNSSIKIKDTSREDATSLEGGVGGGEKDAFFESFWSAYPRKQGKGAARKAWKKLSEPATKLKLILEALSWQKETAQWKKENGQYIPMPATYLNQDRWLDEKPKQSTSGIGGEEWMKTRLSQQ